MLEANIQRRSEYRPADYVASEVEVDLKFSVEKRRRMVLHALAESGRTVELDSTRQEEGVTVELEGIDKLDVHEETVKRIRVDVTATLKLQPNPQIHSDTATGELPEIHLDKSSRLKLKREKGEDVEIKSVAVDGRILAADEFTVTDDELILKNTKGACSVTVETVHYPERNIGLQGLYESSGLVVTQFESISFRELTPSLDRPDVMPAKWVTTFTAPKNEMPTVLATGNLTESRDNGDGTHSGRYESNVAMSPHVYAVVAGNCEKEEATYETKSGRKIKLEVYAKPGDAAKGRLALWALQNTLRWDEEHFGLEYPLDEYRLVIVDDFNAGAMENLGLNVYNASRVAGHPRTQTDTQIKDGLMVVFHESAHTWRGNMVSVRSWHEIALKEGFATYAEQRHSEELLGPTSRINNVRELRRRQFAEDAGATAHPIVQDQYEGDPMNRMYTRTTYLKGSEVIGMLETILGEAGFRKGCDQYFSENKGKAVRIEDLIAAMEQANKTDLTLFRNWFKQVGTPVCKVDSAYDAATQTFTLNVHQECPREPKLPVHIPLVMGLINGEGREIPLELEGDASGHDLKRGLINVTSENQTFVFKNVPAGVVPSLGRHFSAPVKIEYDYKTSDLLRLMQHDTDQFNQYDSSERVAKQCIKDLMAGGAGVGEEVLQAYGHILNNISDPALAAEMLSIPDELTLAQDMKVYDFTATKQARDKLCKAIATRFEGRFAELYSSYGPRDEDDAQADQGIPDIKAMDRRRLHNVCLEYLVLTGKTEHVEKIRQQMCETKNMTDELNAFHLLCGLDSEREAATQAFHEKWKQEDLVMNNWLRAQALMDNPHVLEVLKGLVMHPDFDFKRPAKVRSLLDEFVMNNVVHFHDEEGKGYAFIADMVLKIPNDKVAASLVKKAFSYYPNLKPTQKELMRVQLERLQNTPGAHNDVLIEVKKILDPESAK